MINENIQIDTADLDVEVQGYPLLDVHFEFSPSYCIPGRTSGLPEDCYPDDFVDFEYKVTHIILIYESNDSCDKSRQVILQNKTLSDFIKKYPFIEKAIDAEIIDFNENYMPDEEEY